MRIILITGPVDSVHLACFGARNVKLDRHLYIALRHPISRFFMEADFIDRRITSGLNLASYPGEQADAVRAGRIVRGGHPPFLGLREEDVGSEGNDAFGGSGESQEPVRLWRLLVRFHLIAGNILDRFGGIVKPFLQK